MSQPSMSAASMDCITAIYRVRGEAGSIEDRARAIAIEQSVEMPVAAIEDCFVLSRIVGHVGGIENLASGLFEVRVELSSETVAEDAGQLLNILFGNTSLHDDVVLHDVALPKRLAQAFGGPRHGVQGLRARVGASGRALTCSALKPQGFTPDKLAALAKALAAGGIDFIKDDHGLADQAYSPFAARVEAIAAALVSLNQPPEGRTRYVPSLSGDLDSMRRQIGAARGAGIDAVLVAPMIAGFANALTLVCENPDFAFMAHPTMGGASRIAPPLLIGKLFRLIGMDAVVFPNYGGRFGYSREACRDLARAALMDWHGLKPALPTPAGGMTRERVDEILDFYGPDIMLLIGGDLLSARDHLTEEAAAFVAAVTNHRYG